MPRTGEVTRVRLTRSSSALPVAVALLSSVRASLSSFSASLRKRDRVSATLRSTSFTAASARGIARVVASSWPRFSTSPRLSRSSSTWDIAPWATSGSDMEISWRNRFRLLRYCACLETNSRSSCCFCTSCCCRPSVSSLSCCWRLWNSASSLLAWPGTLARTSSGMFSARSSTSADRRSTRRNIARRSASVSPTLDWKRVGSRRISCSPACTTCPSWTNICETMPPSRFWIFCTLDEGIALPSPRVTSSICAKCAQSSRKATKPMRIQMVRRTTRGASSISALLTSGSGWPERLSPPLK